MLELCRDEITQMMGFYGAVKISHDNTVVDYALNEGGDLYDLITSKNVL